MQLLKSPVFERILAKKKAIDKLRPLPQQLLNQLREQMQTEFTYNSNAIEGNTLTLRETQLVIQEGMTIRGKSIREHLEAKNHPEAIHYIETLAERGRQIREQDILSVHRLIMRGIDEQNAGRYRTGQVRIAGATFTPPPLTNIQPMIGELLRTRERNPEELRPIEMAAYFHHKLAYIHPFLDGNGRTARLLTNTLLLQDGYPFTIMLKVDRPRYLRSLSEADYGNLTPFAEFTARSVERSLDIYLLVLQKDAELLTLAEAAKKTAYSQEYLSLLARKGSLGAFKLRRNWVITMRALNDYLKTHSRS